MTFGRTLIDPELLSDVSIRQTFTNEGRHLSLSLGEAGNGGLAENGKAEEAADLADQGIDIPDIGEMRSSGKFDQTRTSDTRRNDCLLYTSPSPRDS